MAKIVRTDRELELPGVDSALRAAGHELLLLPDGIAERDLLDAAQEAELILMCYTPLTRRVIEAAPRLRGIVKYGVGIDAIDIAAARERGIPVVVNVPEYAEETVAEGAFALLMALAKNLKKLEKAMRRRLGVARAPLARIRPRRQDRRHCRPGSDRRELRPHGDGLSHARALAYDPYVAQATHRDLRAMLAECDFVSIHCVLNPETRHLIGERELRAMKPSAYLINVSRGAIVDELALLRTLERGGIAGAALDVYSQEPLAKQGHPLSALYAMDNVILSPHLTFYTREAMARLEADTLERCREVLERRPVTVRSRDPRLRSQTRAYASTVEVFERDERGVDRELVGFLDQPARFGERHEAELGHFAVLIGRREVARKLELVDVDALGLHPFFDLAQQFNAARRGRALRELGRDAGFLPCFFDERVVNRQLGADAAADEVVEHARIGGLAGRAPREPHVFPDGGVHMHRLRREAEGRAAARSMSKSPAMR